MISQTVRDILAGAGCLIVDVRVLLLGGPDDDPATLAWQAELTQSGAAFDMIRPSPAAPIRPINLIRAPDHGRYNAVVMTTDSSNFLSSVGALQKYCTQFGVRQLAAFEYPRPAVGLSDPEGRAVGGETAQLTSAGRAVFPYLRGPVPVEEGSFAYLTTQIDDSIFTPCVALSTGEPLVGVADTGEGLEEMVVTVNYAEPMIQWRLLARGLLSWVTRGVHLGLTQQYLSCHVDDIFLASAKSEADWDESPSPDAVIVRMSAADVDAALEWQRQNDFVLDLVYNGAGAVTSGADDLTTALLRNREHFRWVNHTWSHMDLSAPLSMTDEGVPRWQHVNGIREQIELNREWAESVGIDASPTALVTGAHSGLDNPNMPTALERSGISAIATDASRKANKAAIGPALAVPRHPTNVATHVCRWDDALEDYNRRYSGQVRPLETPREFLAAESDIMLRHMLSNDPRPTFGHQANLSGDRPLLRLLESALQRYRAYFSAEAPIVSPTMDDVAQALQRRASWHQALASDQVSAVLADGELVVTSLVDVDVPLTLPTGASLRKGWAHRDAFGQSYCCAAIGWQPVSAGQVLRIVIDSSQSVS